MSKGHHLRKPEERFEAAGKIESLMKAFRVVESDVEGLDESLDFPAFREKAAKLPMATDATRPRAAFDAALYRSLRYSVVGGVYCHTAGLRGHFRALYEGCRLMHPLDQKD